jgi:WD40 repeat protein
LAASAGVDGRVRVWDLSLGELRTQFERASRAVLLGPDGRVLWAITDSHEVWALDLTSGLELERVWAPPRRGLHNTRPERAALSPDGCWMLAAWGGDDGHVRVIDLLRGRDLDLRAPGAGELYPVGTFSDDGRSVLLLGGVRDGRSGRHRPALYRFALHDGTPEEIRALRLSRNHVTVATALHRDRCAFAGRWLVAVDGPGRLALRWDVTHDDPVTWIAMGLDRGESLAVGARTFAVSFSRDRAVAVLDHDAAAIVATHPMPRGEAATAIALTPDGTSLVVGASSGRAWTLPLSP